MTPEESKQVLNVVSYGGGTQSTAMILMALEGLHNLPRPDFGVYADTGGEPQFINDYVGYFIDMVKGRYNFTIYKVMHKDGLLHNLTIDPAEKKSGISYTSSQPPYFTLDNKGKKGMLMRQCTEDYKINPIQKFINFKKSIGQKVRLWIGISFDERTRMKLSRFRNQENYYPLVENFIGRMDSINFVKSLGIKQPQRSSCFFCPYHSNRYWHWLKNEHPKEFQRAVEFENVVQQRQNDSKKYGVTYYLHRECKPLDTIQFINEDQLNLFPELIDECDGYCGI